MPRFYPVAVEVDGRTYTGEWALIQGGEVRVRSPAYGSDRAPVDRRKPELVAVEVLRKIVKDYHLKRDRDARQIERETLRVARSGRPSRPKRKAK